MTLPRHQRLRQKASLAIRSGDFETALGIYRQLEQLLPDDPTWPERCAGAYHELGRGEEELGSLLRALELQVDGGQVLAAIATCKLILDIEPDHPSTLECLHLLYSEPGAGGDSSSGRRAAEVSRARSSLPTNSNAPMVELELTHAIPGARALALGNDDRGGVAEIPLEESGRRVDRGRAASGRGRKAKTSPPTAGRRRAAASSASESGAGRKGAASTAREELARMPLFGSLDAQSLHSLMSKVRVVRLAAGEVLFQEGDDANALYVVVDGAVVPIAEGATRRRLAVLEKGEFFGEAGLVTNQPRNATIEALVDSRLLAIDRRVMWSLIRGQPEMSKVILRFLRERLIDRHIATNAFFEAFAREERSAVAQQFRFLEAKDGSSVVEQGCASEGLFVLLAGQMDVIDPERGKHLDSLGPGDLFGGIPLIRGTPASSSVVANGKCWVLVLDEDHFYRILDANPGLEDGLNRLADQGGGDQYLI